MINNLSIKKVIVVIVAIFIVSVIFIISTYIYRNYLKTYEVPLVIFPTSATITLNGKSVELNDRALNLPIGDYTLQIKAEGYSNRSLSFTVSEDKETQDTQVAALTPSTDSAIASYNNNEARTVFYEDDKRSNGLYTVAPIDTSAEGGFSLTECASVRYTISALCFQDANLSTNPSIIKRKLANYSPRYPITLYEIYPISQRGAVVYQSSGIEVVFIDYTEGISSNKSGLLIAYTKSSRDAVIQQLRSAYIDDRKFDIMIEDPSNKNNEFEVN